MFSQRECAASVANVVNAVRVLLVGDTKLLSKFAYECLVRVFHFRFIKS